MITAALRTFQLGLRGVARHGLRSLLTSLGVLFGVASVIAMLAIGTGTAAASTSRPSRAPRAADTRTRSTSATASASEIGRAHGLSR